MKYLVVCPDANEYFRPTDLGAPDANESWVVTQCLRPATGSG